MGPIDYASSYQPINIGQQFLGGLQAGAAIGSIENTAQKQQLALEQQKQYQAGVQEALANPTPQAFASLALRFPAQREAVKQGWDQMSEGDRNAESKTMSQAYAALQSDQPDIAKQVIQQQIDARKNSGLPTTDYDNALALVNNDPVKAKGSLGLILSHVTDPKTFAAQFSTLGKAGREADLAPAELRTANAEAGSKEAEAAQKSLAVVGSTLGALEGKNAKPEQVQTALKSLAQKGLISKDELPDYIAAIPTDAKQRNEWLGALRMAGLKPEDQAKYKTPDANAQLSSDTQIKTTGMNNATQVQTTRMNNQASLDREDRIAKRMSDKADVEASLDAETLKSMAEQYVDGGDKSVLQNLGRGAQGAANLVALRGAITQTAKDRGMSGAQIAAKLADYAGLTAGIRTSAQISARVENAIQEAKALIPLAREASRNVVRSGFLPFGKAQIMFDTNSNDPALAAFATRNQGLVNAYVGAMARGGKGTVDDKHHAEKLITEAKSDAAYQVVLDNLEKEMEAASSAPQAVREHLKGEISGKPRATAKPAAAAPALPGGWTVREH